MEHNAWTMLRHVRLNRVFALAGVSYQPHPEPIARAMKKRKTVTAMVQLPPPKKTVKRKKRKIPSGLKDPLAFTVGDDSGYASMHAIDSYSSSMSEEEASLHKRHRKRAHKSSSPKASLKPLGPLQSKVRSCGLLVFLLIETRTLFCD
jgi:hypothetical protein